MSPVKNQATIKCDCNPHLGEDDPVSRDVDIECLNRGIEQERGRFRELKQELIETA